MAQAQYFPSIPMVVIIKTYIHWVLEPLVSILYGLVLSGSVLYGCAHNGGTNNTGTIFSINTDGSNYQDLYSLGTGTAGQNPYGLVLSGSVLYGTCK